MTTWFDLHQPNSVP